MLADGIVSAYDNMWTALKQEFKKQYADCQEDDYVINTMKPDDEKTYRDSHTINIDTIALLLLQDKLSFDPFYIDPRQVEIAVQGLQLPQRYRNVVQVQPRGFAITESFVNMPAERRNTLRL
jgi:hypothetical protein